MHMWNWITGVRAGAHISISSSTELKFYHLLVFKAKNIQLTLQGKKSRQSIFFTGRAGLQLPCPTHTAELSAWSSWRVRRKWNAHVSIPLSWISSLAKLLFSSSHEQSQDQKSAREGDTCCIFPQTNCTTRSCFLKKVFGKRMQHTVFTPRFRALIRGQKIKCNKINIKAH